MFTHFSFQVAKHCCNIFQLCEWPGLHTQHSRGGLNLAVWLMAEEMSGAWAAFSLQRARDNIVIICGGQESVSISPWGVSKDWDRAMYVGLIYFPKSQAQQTSSKHDASSSPWILTTRDGITVSLVSETIQSSGKLAWKDARNNVLLIWIFLISMGKTFFFFTFVASYYTQTHLDQNIKASSI